MRKGTDLIGKPIIAYDSGSKLASVKDLIFSQDQSVLVALLVEEPGWFSAGKIVPLSQVQAIGADGVLVRTEDSIVSAKEIPMIKNILDHRNILRGTEIMTLTGRNLGRMVDLYFDAHTGNVEGYEVSGGIFADAYTGRSFVPDSATFRIGQDFAFVPDTVIGLMEEQVGGFKGAMIATGGKVQELAQQATDTAQEIGSGVAGKLGEAQEKAVSAVTDAVVAPEQQKQFVIGRTAQSDVLQPDGSTFLQQTQTITASDADLAESLGILDALYRSAGGDVVAVAQERISHKAGQLSQAASTTIERAAGQTREAVASYTVEETLGRRVRTTVYSREGDIIAATGQIVNYPIINKAREYHQESALMNATGLSVKSAAKTQTQLIANQAGTQAQQIGEQVQYQASNAIEWVKHTTHKLYAKSTTAIEEQRIKGALGRPVNRVILDYGDNVILNVGELVTHKALRDAEQAGVLDILLSSIHDEEPDIRAYEMRAAQNGRAALAKAQ